MRLISTIVSFARRMRRGSAVEQDLDDEARAFVDLLTDEKIHAGLTPIQARRQALIEFGGLEQVKENTRASRSGFWLENLARDIMYACRMLRRDLAFTLISVVSLTLGIGANAAVFSVMHALLFRNIPVPHPERMFRIGLLFSGQDILLSGPMFDALQKLGNAFPESMAWAEFQMFWEEPESSRLVNVAVMSGNGFSVLNLQPELGRLLIPQDDAAGGGSSGFAAVVSHRFWKSYLGGNVSALNRKLVLSHVPVTIVGVMPQRFEGMVIGSAPDLVLPLEYEVRANGASSQRHFFGSTWLTVFGRRGDEETFGRAASQLQTLAPAILKEAIPPQMQSALLPRLSLKLYPGYNGGVSEASFHGPTFRDLYRRPIFIAQALVGFLLLLCVTNLSALQLARAKAREHELAIRTSLGASSSRIMAQLLVESTLMGIAGAILGLLTGYLISGALGSFLVSRRWSLDTRPDLTVALLVFAGGIACMVLSGLAPFVFGRQSHFANALNANRSRITQSAADGKRGARLLIPLQVSVCMVLLVSAGLFLTTLSRLTNAPLGFDPQGVIMFPFELGSSPAAMARNRVAEFKLLEGLHSAPAVSAIALLDNPPIAGGDTSTTVQVQGTARIDRRAPVVGVGPGYLEVMRTRLVEGREFRSSDTQDSPPVCMLSMSAARYFFPVLSAVGGMLVMPEPRSPSVPPQCEVVGVTEDSRYHDVRTESARLIYINIAQSRFPAGYILIRTNNAAEARRKFARLSHRLLPGVDFFPAASLTDQIRDTIGRERLLGNVSSIFAVLALLVTGAGLYGFLAWSVVRRTSEIGIRVALGADQSAILWMIAKETLLLLFIGITSGSLASYFLSKLAASLLYATNPTDPAIFCGAVASLLALGVLTVSVPARRAARLEPMIALRSE